MSAGERGGIAIAGAARTPVCRAGSRLSEVSALALATAAAGGALAGAGIDAGEIAAVVVAVGLAADPDELSPARSLLEAIGADAALAVPAGGVPDLGLGALAAGRAIAATAGAPVLVVGAESASRVPYWVPGARSSTGDGGNRVSDPLGRIVALAGERAAALAGAAGGRAAQDAFAARSHRLSSASAAAAEQSAPATRIVAVAGIEADEPSGANGSPDDLALLKPLFDPAGTATAASTALPADGAAAVVLTPAGSGILLGPPASTASAALEAAGVGVDQISAAELHEGTAGEALAVAAGIGLEQRIVNGAGGAIGQGLPFTAAGLLMVQRLAERVDPGTAGLLYAPGWAFVVST